MGVVRQKEDLLTRIRDLERQVRELRRRNISNAAISQGSLEVRTPDGFLIARIGEFDADGTPSTGMEIYRRSGGLQARFFDTTGTGGGGYWALFDEAGNIVASEDTYSGVGLATPYLSQHAVPWTNVVTPSVITVNASFETMWRVHLTRQQPRIRVRTVTKSDAATTGEIQLVMSAASGGATISTVTPIPAADFTYRQLIGVLPVVDHMTYLEVDVVGRRTAGAGNVRVEVVGVETIQS